MLGWLDAIEEFESDDAAARLMGKSWLGLDTKFRLIEYGIKVRKYFVDQAGRDAANCFLQWSRVSRGARIQSSLAKYRRRSAFFEWGFVYVCSVWLDGISDLATAIACTGALATWNPLRSLRSSLGRHVFDQAGR